MEMNTLIMQLLLNISRSFLVYNVFSRLLDKGLDSCLENLDSRQVHSCPPWHPQRPGANSLLDRAERARRLGISGPWDSPGVFVLWLLLSGMSSLHPLGFIISQDLVQ